MASMTQSLRGQGLPPGQRFPVKGPPSRQQVPASACHSRLCCSFQVLPVVNPSLLNGPPEGRLLMKCVTIINGAQKRASFLRGRSGNSEKRSILLQLLGLPWWHQSSHQ